MISRVETKCEYLLFHHGSWHKMDNWKLVQHKCESGSDLLGSTRSKWFSNILYQNLCDVLMGKRRSTYIWSKLFNCNLNLCFKFVHWCKISTLNDVFNFISKVIYQVIKSRVFNYALWVTCSWHNIPHFLRTLGYILLS